GLADAVGAVGGLVLDGGVPPAVVVDDVVGAGQVEAGAGGFERQQEHRRPPVLEAADHLLAAGHGGAAVQELGVHAALVQVPGDQAGHGHVLGEDQHGAVLGEDGGDELVQQLQLAGAARQPGRGLVQVLGGVVADLLEPGEQFDDEAAPGHALGVLDAAHHLAHDRLVQGGLFGGEGDRPVGLGLGRQFGRDAGGGLAAARQERPHQPRQPLARCGAAGLDGPGPAGAEAGQRAEQAGGGPVEDGPQVRQVVLDGGAGEGDAGGGGDVAQGAGGGRGGVLDVLGLVGDDQVPRVRG